MKFKKLLSAVLAFALTASAFVPVNASADEFNEADYDSIFYEDFNDISSIDESGFEITNDTANAEISVDTDNKCAKIENKDKYTSGANLAQLLMPIGKTLSGTMAAGMKFKLSEGAPQLVYEIRNDWIKFVTLNITACGANSITIAGINVSGDFINNFGTLDVLFDIDSRTYDIYINKVKINDEPLKSTVEDKYWERGIVGVSVRQNTQYASVGTYLIDDMYAGMYRYKNDFSKNASWKKVYKQTFESYNAENAYAEDGTLFLNNDDKSSSFTVAEKNQNKYLVWNRTKNGSEIHIRREFSEIKTGKLVVSAKLKFENEGGKDVYLYTGNTGYGNSNVIRISNVTKGDTQNAAKVTLVRGNSTLGTFDCDFVSRFGRIDMLCDADARTFDVYLNGTKILEDLDYGDKNLNRNVNLMGIYANKDTGFTGNMYIDDLFIGIPDKASASNPITSGEYTKVFYNDFNSLENGTPLVSEEKPSGEDYRKMTDTAKSQNIGYYDYRGTLTEGITSLTDLTVSKNPLNEDDNALEWTKNAAVSYDGTNPEIFTSFGDVKNGVLVFSSKMKFYSGEQYTKLELGAAGGRSYINVIILSAGNDKAKIQLGGVTYDVIGDFTDEFARFDIITDVTNRNYDFYINGTKINTEKLNWGEAFLNFSQTRNVNMAAISQTRNMPNLGTMYIDDIYVGTRTYNDDEIVEADFNTLNLTHTDNLMYTIDLPMKGTAGSNITWSSDSELITISANSDNTAYIGKITNPVGEDVKAKLTAVLTSGDKTKEKEFDVVIAGLRKYSLDGIIYKDLNGNEVYGIPSGGSVSGVRYTNNSDTDAVLITALYKKDSENGLALQKTVISNAAKGEKLVTVSGMDIPSEGSYTVKAMLWSGMDKIVPLCDMLSSDDTVSSVRIAGDSTVETYAENSETRSGWGQVIGDFLADTAVKNYAISGRSTRSFINEGRLDTVLGDLQKGEYVLIQFGHNDQKKSTDQAVMEGSNTDSYANEAENATEYSYREYLKEYTELIRNRGGVPVFVTPVPRLRTDDSDVFKNEDALQAYADAMKAVAESEGVICVDLRKRANEFFNGMIRDELGTYYVSDCSHFTRAGAEKMAELITNEFSSMLLPIKVK